MSGAILHPVHVVTASAGTGKTHRLIAEVGDSVAAGTEPSKLVATTFTIRAAAELVSRARSRLVQDGKQSEAQGLLAGRVGTVNAVFGALLREFAFEGGRSPVTEVIPEDRAETLFRIAADAAIGTHADRLQSIAERFGYAEAGGRGASWQKLVLQTVALARANGITPEQLEESRERSWQALEPLLESAQSGETGEGLDTALKSALSSAIDDIGLNDTSVGTAKAIQRLKEIATVFARGQALSWQQWAQLTKVKATKASDRHLEAVRAAAAAHTRHPRLRADMEDMIRGVFDCAAEALTAYQSYKLARGLVDFADQEAGALQLLDRPDVARILGERIELALVDEFQDTSPIQLALFLRLAGIVKRSLWVGDPKQSIYGFRGSDPELMSKVAGQIAGATGGSTESLDKSYRARPGLLSFFNDLFVPTFEGQGIPREQSECQETARSDAKGQGLPLAVWHVGGSNQDKRPAALASGVRRMLDDGKAWSIVPKGAEKTRPLRGGDVAILCRRGKACREVAAALEAVGLRVALGREGLLETVECALPLAGLRWLADNSDTLALAEIAHLTDVSPDGAQPAWFATVVENDNGIARLRAGSIPVALEVTRSGLLSMTPSEVLDAAIEATGVLSRVASWGNTTQRLANIDALRACARDYEEDRRQSRQPATAGGLADWLAENGGEKPPAGDDAAITVCTYHAAKGLEWPAVILYELDFSGGPRLFDQVVAEGAAGGIDLRDPLKSRWLRFWPWPYGAQAKDVGLDTRATQTALGQAAATRASHEQARLLYVATTRARDYLVLAVDKPKNEIKASALDKLVSRDGATLLSLPLSEDQPLKVATVGHQCRVWSLTDAPPAEGSSEQVTAAVYDMAPLTEGVTSTHPPYRFRPSESLPDGESRGTILERLTLGPRLALVGSPEMAALGDAVHGFLAADIAGQDRTARRQMAAQFLIRWGVGGALSPDDVVTAADRLWSFCSTQWPTAKIVREWPIVGRKGLQRVQGRIDLLLETKTGFIVIDHKTYPGRADTWEARAVGYAAQLDLYGRLCAAAADKPVEGLFVHLPVAGAMLRVGSHIQ